MREWQPIETAPKDTAVMLYAGGYLIGHFSTFYNLWCTETDGMGTPGERMLNSWLQPTHWRPLPERPSE